MSYLSDFITNGNIFPAVIADSSYELGRVRSYEVGGFLNNGDYLSLPTTDVGVVVYRDNTGAPITTGSWSGNLLLANISTNVDKWIGFMLDDTDGVMYMMASDVTTTPDTYYFSKITAAGVLTNLWNTASLNPGFSTNPVWGEGNIYRDSDGSGNITVRNVAGESAIFDISTGSIVQQVVSTGHPVTGTYATPSGNVFGTSVGTGGFILGTVSNSTRVAGFILSSSQGYVSANTANIIPMQWGGRIVMAGLNDSLTWHGIRAVTVTDFNIMVDRIADIMGV